MPLKDFYFVYGDDVGMIERKYLPDLQNKYSEATWLRYDLTIDEINPGDLLSEYYTNDLFSESKVIVFRNVDKKSEKLVAFLAEVVKEPVARNAVILVASGWNKTTKLGKLVKKHFITREFSLPEIKPFDLLDSLNVKQSARVLRFSNMLFDSGYNPLALFSLILGHFILLKQIKEREGKSVDVIAREIKQHRFRVQKAMSACRHWSMEQINGALKDLDSLDKNLRSWQYDEQMLIQMSLIKLCL